MPRAFDPRRGERPLFDALLDARERHGGSKPILEDQDRRALSYTDLVRASFALGRKIAGFTRPREAVGVLLPSSVGGVVTFFALQASGRTPVMLNFTSGARNLKAACRAAGVKSILTSRRFTEQGKFEQLAQELGTVATLVWLEDVRAAVGPADKAYAALAGLMPRLFRARRRPDEPGVILFTSGSFGAPRGVVLSQCNLVANVEQVDAHIDLDPDWVFFNPLPIFHAFGLIGLLLPLLTGMKAFQYPSPLHYKQIPDLIRATGASVLMATDTFLNQYARNATAEDFESLQFIVCGAEKVREDTHRTFAGRFGGIPVLEGYGATECSPVIAVNQPDANYPGSVGRLLPGLETRLEPVPGIEEGGRLFVRGPNVMKGYLGPTPDSIDPLPGGWHDTGDVVTIDEQGVVRVKGRVKRFAKIGGEMVSLTAVEDVVSQVWPGWRHAVISVPDARKGERLVLVTDCPEAEVGAIAAWCRRTGSPEIAVPKRILKVDEVPVLGSGKVDYVAIQQMADSQGEAAA